MNNITWALAKLGNVRALPRYVRESYDFVRGIARAKTLWGDVMEVPFPEFRTLVENGYIAGNGEVGVYNYLSEHLSSKDVFFDLGANAGFYTLLGAHKGADTYAFEPFPSTFKLLEKNTRGKKVHLVNCAVSDKSGTLKMESHYWPGHNKISDHGTVEVRAIALDEFGVVPTVMKIDIEYHEIEALKGAANLIKEHKPIIVAEVSERSIEYLKGLGYHATCLGKVNYLFTPR